MFDTSWDAILIGSGVGGLVTGALLAKRTGKKVLVLEAHNQLGGFTHSFSRQGLYRFDVGVHYVGGMHEGSELRLLFDFVSGGRLRWNRLPDDMDHLCFEDEDFVIPARGRDLRLSLQSKFPNERDALDNYFKSLPKFSSAYLSWFFSEIYPSPLRSAERLMLHWRYPEIFQTTQHVLSSKFKSPRLIEILTAQWPGFGVSPQQSSFGFHCVHVSHYLEGAWFPEHGTGAIAGSIVEEIERNRGRVVTNSKVDSILTSGGQVRGVRVHGREIHAHLVISNAGAKKTYLELLDQEVGFKNSLASLPPGPSALVIYLGLKDSPTRLGFNASNYWLLEGAPLYLSFPSLKHPSQNHTAELMCPITTDEFSSWQNTSWKRRPEDYARLKQNLGHEALARVENRFPGFKDLIGFQEISTPLTVRHFMGSPDGAIFGLPATPERFHWPWATSRTPIEGLFLTGSDVLSSGVGGAALGGLKSFELVAHGQSFKNSLQIRRQLGHYIKDVPL